MAVGSVEVVTTRFHPLEQVRLVVVGPNDLRRGVHALGQHLRRPALVTVMRNRTSAYPVGRPSRRAARFIPVLAGFAVVRVAVVGTDAEPTRLGDDVEPGANRTLGHSTRSLPTGEHRLPSVVVLDFGPVDANVLPQEFTDRFGESDRTPAVDAVFQRRSRLRPVSEVDERDAHGVEVVLVNVVLVGEPVEVVVGQVAIAQVERPERTETSASVPRKPKQRVVTACIIVPSEVVENRFSTLRRQLFLVRPFGLRESRHVHLRREFLRDRFDIGAELQKQFDSAELVVQRALAQAFGTAG